jgi:hypothetical protein
VPKNFKNMTPLRIAYQAIKQSYESNKTLNGNKILGYAKNRIHKNVQNQAMKNRAINKIVEAAYRYANSLKRRNMPGSNKITQAASNSVYLEYGI